MALSNWDTFSVDQNNKPLAGELVTPSGILLRIYKNWLYVSDPIGWRDTKSYIEPTVMQIQEGNLQYRDLHVFAKRGEHDSVLVIAGHTDWKNEENTKLMAGIGTYGYNGEDWEGTRPSEIQELNDFLTYSKEEVWWLKNYWTFGIQGGARFNQGDAYFAKNLGFDTPITEVGEAQESILMQIIKPEG